MPEKCAYPPCKCRETHEGGYCGDYCEAIAVGIVGAAAVEPEGLPKNNPARLKCGCGHQACAERH